ncbi:MAG: uroporphyrinogen-III C-methyltransferase [Faecalibacterium sp.]|nr:uroporphyrinogen-III C-methyltransferase [Ruminococcus sp.]MCM1392969.1 uroporphyrinogen-III C-methyltransferase [Ruminococcus sp.]MCM1486577.1 uroporphyrinogen-III C-methyltransferase [Faecalibacterium sp.]
MVTLVGAGCGRGLITLKGLEKIKKADVIVYDDLIDDNLLTYAKQNCELVYVGKRIGKHSENQQRINDILIEKALDNKYVVRLKGGDSFVFGRGGEEILALKNENIPYELIPGVTSAVAVPEEFGIPVTHRGVAQSFTVVTGHTATETEEDYSALARLKGTLVFLMGLHNAANIQKKLIENGKNKNTPCAILSNGFSADGMRINCTLSELADAAEKAQTPAIIVIGKTAEYDFSKTISHELDGVSVMVTGTRQFVNKLSGRLYESGAQTVCCPYLEIEPIENAVPMNLDGYTWLVFTSANGVDIFFNHMKKQKIDYRSLSHLKFACIGKGSADRLGEYGFNADFIPSVYTAKVLGEQLGKVVKGSDKLLILRAENGSAELTEELDNADVSYDDIHTYRAVGNIADDINCKSDYIVFASGSSVDLFFKSGGQLGNAVPVCIGEVTAKRLKKYTERKFLTAKEHSADGIIEMIKENQNEKISKT